MINWFYIILNIIGACLILLIGRFILKQYFPDKRFVWIVVAIAVSALFWLIPITSNNFFLFSSKWGSLGLSIYLLIKIFEAEKWKHNSNKTNPDNPKMEITSSYLEDIDTLIHDLTNNPNNNFLIVCEWIDGVNSTEDLDKMKSLEKELTGNITLLYGPPTYAGPGKRIIDYDGPNLEKQLGYFFRKSLALSYWESENKIIAVIVTGHDSDTLLILNILAKNKD